MDGWLEVRGFRPPHASHTRDFAFRLGRWTCISGGFGSGKSALAVDVIGRAVERLRGGRPRPLAYPYPPERRAEGQLYGAAPGIALASEAPIPERETIASLFGLDAWARGRVLPFPRFVCPECGHLVHRRSVSECVEKLVSEHSGRLVHLTRAVAAEGDTGSLDALTIDETRREDLRRTLETAKREGLERVALRHPDATDPRRPGPLIGWLGWAAVCAGCGWRAPNLSPGSFDWREARGSEDSGPIAIGPELANVRLDGRALGSVISTPVELLTGFPEDHQISIVARATAALHGGAHPLTAPLRTLPLPLARALRLARAALETAHHEILVVDGPSAGLDETRLTALGALLRSLLPATATVIFADNHPVVAGWCEDFVTLVSHGPEHFGPVRAASKEQRTAALSIDHPAWRAISLPGATLLRGASLPKGALDTVFALESDERENLRVAGSDASTQVVRGKAPSPPKVIALRGGSQHWASRSNVASRLGVAKPLFELLARSEEARIAGVSADAFDVLRTRATPLRCERCLGRGRGPADERACTACGGTRYSDAARDIRWQGLNVVEWLASSVFELKTRLPHMAAKHRLDIAASLGLNHVKLGDAVSALSTAEAFLTELAGELATTRHTTTVLLDLPRTHFTQEELRALESRLTESAHVLGHAFVIA